MKQAKLCVLAVAILFVGMSSALGNPWPPPWDAGIVYDEDAYSYVEGGDYSAIGSEAVAGGEWYWWHMVFNGVDYDPTYQDDGVMGGFAVYDTACSENIGGNDPLGNDPHLLDTATYHEVRVLRQGNWEDVTSAWTAVHEEQSNWVVAWQMAHQGEVVQPGEEIIFRMAFDRALSSPEFNAIHVRQLGPGDEDSEYVANSFGWYEEPGDEVPEPGTWALLLATAAFGGWIKRRKR